MATDYAVRVRIDESELGTAETARMLSRILRVLDVEAPTIGFAASYTAGDRTYNVLVSVGTITTADMGFEVLVDAAKSADLKTDILRRILHVLADQTLALSALNTTYAAGTTSVNQVSLTIA